MSHGASAKETVPDPRRPLNCKTVDKADMNFCVARNQIVMECANRRKHPDFDQCFANYISNPPLPKAADCSRVSPEKTSEWKVRNKVYKECTQDPMRYFVCLAEKMRKR